MVVIVSLSGFVYLPLCLPAVSPAVCLIKISGHQLKAGHFHTSICLSSPAAGLRGRQCPIRLCGGENHVFVGSLKPAIEGCFGGIKTSVLRHKCEKEKQNRSKGG